MSRPRLPYLQRETTRHHKVVWYLRAPQPDGSRPKRIRIKGEYGSPEFISAYHAAMRGEAPQERRQKATQGTMAWLVDRYRESAVWANLKHATRKQRENIFHRILKESATFPYAKVEKRHVQAGMDRRAKTPGAANNYLKTTRALFSWAVESDLLQSDPSKDVKRFRLNSDGFYSWSPEDVEKFRAHWPIGTRERLAMEVFLFTGLRKGDASRLGRQHIKNGVAMLRTEKTNTPVYITIRPELQAVIDQSPLGELVLVGQLNGSPMTKETFGNWFGKAAKAAGIPGNGHGLRKTLATMLAESGATEAQMNAAMGWADGSKESATYIRKANRERMAAEAMGKLKK